MGLVLTEHQQPARQLKPLRLGRMRCECGAKATRTVGFFQFNSLDKEIWGRIAVCDACYALIIESDAKVIEIR